MSKRPCNNQYVRSNAFKWPSKNTNMDVEGNFDDSDDQGSNLSEGYEELLQDLQKLNISLQALGKMSQALLILSLLHIRISNLVSPNVLIELVQKLKLNELLSSSDVSSILAQLVETFSQPGSS